MTKIRYTIFTKAIEAAKQSNVVDYVMADVNCGLKIVFKNGGSKIFTDGDSLKSDYDPTQYVRGVFLDISKAFDEVWHEGLLYNLETYGVNILRKYLHERYQRVVLNGQTSSWELKIWSTTNVLSWASYVFNKPDNIKSTCKFFGDDACLFSHVFDKSTSQSELNKDLQAISKWAFQWKMQFNRDPNKQAQE